jgi:DNA topoisomerase-3
VAKELIESLRASRDAGEDPGVGRTAKPVTGFRSRAGRTFRAKLKLEQDEEGKWRVDFDEEWAKEPPKGESEEERAETRAAAPAGEPAGPADGDGARREPARSSARTG